MSSLQSFIDQSATPSSLDAPEIHYEAVGGRESARTVVAQTKSGTDTESGIHFPVNWLRIMREAVTTAGLPWHEPAIFGDEDELCFEWWRRSRSLTVFVRGFSVEVLRSWGPDVEADMHSEFPLTRDEVLREWTWFLER